jgi:hypothetical protein
VFSPLCVQFSSSAFGHGFKTGKAESGIYLSVEYIRGYGRYRKRSRAGTSKEGVVRCPMLKTLEHRVKPGSELDKN